jgi:hypothetical protein
MRAGRGLEDLEDPLVKRAFEVLVGLPAQPGPLSETLMSHTENDEFSSFVAEVIANFEVPEGTADRSVADTLVSLRKQRLERRQREVHEKWKTCQDASEKKALESERMNLIRELQQVRM